MSERSFFFFIQYSKRTYKLVNESFETETSQKNVTLIWALKSRRVYYRGEFP